MKKYETLFLLPGDVTEEIVQDVTQKVTRLVRNHQGHVTKIDDWGKRRLAYAVQKQSRGHYIYVLFIAPPDLIVALERMMRLETQITKFHIVRLSELLTQAQLDQELRGIASAEVLEQEVSSDPEKAEGNSNLPLEENLKAVANENGI